MTDECGEPIVQLRSGALVSGAIYQTLMDLEERGCRVSVNPHAGTLAIEPTAHADLLEWLSLSWRDVRAILLEADATEH